MKLVSIFNTMGALEVQCRGGGLEIVLGVRYAYYTFYKI